MARQIAGLTQKQLAKKIGMTNQALSNIEVGRCIPNKSTVTKIIKELGVDEEFATSLKNYFHEQRINKDRRRTGVNY